MKDPLNLVSNAYFKYSHDSSKSAERSQFDLGGLNDDVTIVTAFFDIGGFQKGSKKGRMFTPKLYQEWMIVFKYLNNPLYVYVDSMKDFETFTIYRQNWNNKTKIIYINDRKSLWSFGLRKKIAKIYAQKAYPKHHPNTVVAEYSCAMHAKYEVVEKTMQDNKYRTKYFAWLDIGFFRDIKRKTDIFHLHLPPNFNESKIAYNRIGYFHQYGVENIMKKNFVWVNGGFFIGRIDIMYTWVKEYMNWTNYFADRGLMNTDQQVIFSMYQKSFKHGPKTQLQTYRSDGRYGDWFHLAYVCKE